MTNRTTIRNLALLAATTIGCAAADPPRIPSDDVAARGALTTAGLTTLFETSVASGSRLYFGDVNGDGATDLLVLDPTARTIGVRKAVQDSNNKPTFSAPSETITLSACVGAPQIYVADFDHDGTVDILHMLNDTSGTHELWLRNPTKTAYLDPHVRGIGSVPPSTGHGTPAEAAFGDFDADGALDIAQVSLLHHRVYYWRFWNPSGTGWNFDRNQAASWDMDIPLPVNAADYTAGQQRTGNFYASSQHEILLPANSATSSEITLLKVAVPGATSPTVPDPAAITPERIRQWAQGVGSAAEIATAKLDGDNYMDLMQLATSGGVYVWPGANEMQVKSTSENGLPSSKTRCVGATPDRVLFANLDGALGLDMVRVPNGPGDVDVFLGTSEIVKAKNVPGFTSGASWLWVAGGVSEAAVIQALTWTGTPAPGLDEIALRSGDTLTVYKSTGGPPVISTGSDAETRLRNGFDPSKSQPNGTPAEVAQLQLSSWRFDGNDQACKDAIAGYDGVFQSDPPTALLVQKNAATATWDDQGRVIVNFYVAYRVLGNRRYLDRAEQYADRFLKSISRFPHQPTSACSPFSCNSFVNEKVDDAAGTTALSADPNQNLTVALAFALLYGDKASKFATSSGVYTPPGGTAVDLRDVIASEVKIAFGAQNQDPKAPAAFRDALLVTERTCYRVGTGYDRCNTPFDTRYGSFALFSATWISRHLAGDAWYVANLKQFLEPHLLKAAGWINRWSQPGGLGGLQYDFSVPMSGQTWCGAAAPAPMTAPVSEPTSWYVAQKCAGHSRPVYQSSDGGNLSFWDPWYRVASMHFLSANGTPACPGFLLGPTQTFDGLDPQTNKQSTYQPLAPLLLMGIPRTFISSGC